MASRRLTNALRDTIIGNIMQETFAPPIAKKQKEIVDYAVELTRKSIPDEIIEAGETLFKYENNGREWARDTRGWSHGWECSGQSFSFDTGDAAQNARSHDYISINFTLDRSTRVYGEDERGSSAVLKLRDARESHSFFCPSAGQQNRIFLKKQQWDKLTRLNEELKAAGVRAHEAYTAACVAVYQVTTVKRLIEIWPEVEPYIPSIVGGENLPDIRKEDLNRMFSLPSSGSAGKRPEAVATDE